MTKTAEQTTPGKGRFFRGLAFRIAAVALGLVPFVAAEGIFTLLDWGRPEYSDDPFVGFRSVRPLFVPSQDAARWQIAPSRHAFFRPDGFASKKAPNEFRIFCLGGSTVQGRPFEIQTSFTTWLELSLQAAEPTRKWEVVNCGGISYASYRLVPILEEVLGHQPDMVIVYTGHNEFLEDRTYGYIKDIPEVVAGPAALLLRTRTFALLRQAYVQLFGRQRPGTTGDRPVLKTEVDALLDYRGGLDDYHRDEAWRRATIAHFRYNLRRMVQLAADADVPILLVNPVCNLRDCAPFKTQHRHGLTAEELKEWEQLVHRASEYQGKNTYTSTTLLEQALKIDDQHAGLCYLLAKCYDALDMNDKARNAYIQAKEHDICPLRVLEAMNDAVIEVAGQTRTPLVDVRMMFEALNPENIPDGRYLIDHVHPSIEGHQLVGTALTSELIRQGFVHPVDGWKEARKRAYRGHLDSLDNLYFLRGVERLERVRCWTQGKAEGALPRSGSSDPAL